MYSLRDSIIRPNDLIQRLQEIGQDTVAITDHGGSLGGVYLYKELKDAGIKMLHGMEAYICKDAKIKDKNNRYYHLVLLCKNETGRINLNRLITISERPENRYYKPRIDIDILKEHSDGLIVLSACLAGEISRLLLDGEYEAAKQAVMKYKSVFGRDYYLEIQAHDDPEQIAINKLILKLANETQTEVVVTCDAHYVNLSDKTYQNSYAFNGEYREESEGAYIDCYVQSEQEVRSKLSYLDSALVDLLIENTHSIADQCSVNIPLSAPIMPEVSVPAGYASNTEYLMALCNEGFEKVLHFSELDAEKALKYGQRYAYELDSLKRMGFVDYMLLVRSYANVTGRRGIARGSGGGSLICYLLGITQIDPVEHDLYFERFIDVGQLHALEAGEITRAELKVPDIDLDFATDTLGEVLHFLYEKYGEDRVASIGRFGTNKTKGTIRDMCKVLGIDLKEADRIAKSFDAFEISDIDAMIAGDIPASPSANDAIANVARHRELFDYVRKLNGLPKSFGLHPCGKIIAVQDLDYYLPSCYDSDGVRYLQGDMHDTDSLGLVKVDVLGLRTINQQLDTHDMSGEDQEFLNTRQEMNDEKVMQVFRDRDTVGIFQFSSRGMQETLKKMQVDNLDDLAAANALYRPGPMQYIDEYCGRKLGYSSFEYIHPDLEPILSRTYGIMVFQEQLIQIGRLAGLHNPDLLRKATGKKDVKLMAKVRPELEDGLMKRGWSEWQIDRLWKDMIEFSSYSFNKCVSGKTKLLGCDAQCTVGDAYHQGKTACTALSMFEDKSVKQNRVVSINHSGVRETITIATKHGAEITCTRNHKLPTPSGIRYASELSVNDMVFIVDSSNTALQDNIVSISENDPEPVYDIEMQAPAHTFVTDSGFVSCNSHSYAYSMLAYLTAKQKAYHPAEFFAGLMNSYIGESSYVKDNADEIVSDAFKHNINILPFDYRQDHRRCSVRDGAILYGVPLIRDCNQQVADQLYYTSGMKFDHFWQLIRYLLENGVNRTQMGILIRLGFFEAFGNRSALRRVFDLYDTFYGKKQIRNSDANNSPIWKIIERNSSNIGKNGNVLKTRTITDGDAMMTEMESECLANTMDATTFKETADYQKEVLGFVSLLTGKKADRPVLYVKQIFPAKRKADGKVFGRNIVAQSIGSGITTRYTIFNRVFDKDPVEAGDVIHCLAYSRNGQYFNMDNYVRLV